MSVRATGSAKTARMPSLVSASRVSPDATTALARPRSRLSRRAEATKVAALRAISAAGPVRSRMPAAHAGPSSWPVSRDAP